MRQFIAIYDGDRYLGTLHVRTRASTTKGLTRAVRSCGRLYTLGIDGWRNNYNVRINTDKLVIHG